MSHHSSRKYFGCRSMRTLNGYLLDEKVLEISVLMDKIEKMVEVQNLLLD